ncbi:hypothetical protein [Chryseobacterium sp. JUb7]|uniref:hypothetical protein n=1 Tax=Chryseobacterium sp. JUb7 TaxID=2940599 RepID=UPI002168E28F|nr:hypothetical protein [Chryseobacterium sp. JUb7]MCS3530969.1 hypothetical protein [Chryseobacterium sp. JUb7]
MKTKFFFVIISAFLLSCKTREPQIIKYDFSKGRFDTANIKPYHGRPTVLEIRNINNLFYKVEITPQDIAIKDKTLFDETPEPPKKSETPELGEAKGFTSSSKIEKEIDKSQNTTKLEGKVDMSMKITYIENEIGKNNNIIDEKKRERDGKEKQISSLESRLKQMKSFEDLYKDLSIIKADNNEAREIINEKILRRTELENKLNDNKKDLNVINLSIINYESLKNDLNAKLTDLKSKDRTVKDLIINYLSDIKSKYRQLYLSAENISRINGCYNNYIDKVYTSELTYGEYMKIRNKERLENSVIIDLEKLNDFYAEITLFDKEKAELLIKLNDIDLYRIKEKLSELPGGENLITDLNNDINDIIKDITDLSKIVADLNIRKKLNYVESLDRILSTKNSYTYTSVPIQGFEDYLQFDITMVSKTKISDDKYVIDRGKTFKYKEYLKGGVRFDFSIGTVFDIGNKQQEFDIVQDNNGYKIIQTTNNEYIPTIAGMLHSSWRSSNNFAFGVTLGVSMDMTKLQLNSLFPGISLLVGKTDKIIFTAGPALRKVSQLTNGFTLNTSLSSSPEGYISESYKLGWFVGISWNLTNKQKSLMRLSY